jgi:hypothetical protein
MASPQYIDGRKAGGDFFHLYKEEALYKKDKHQGGTWGKR